MGEGASYAPLRSANREIRFPDNEHRGMRLAVIAIIGMMLGSAILLASEAKAQDSQNITWTKICDDPEGDTQFVEGNDIPGGQPWADITLVEVGASPDFLAWRLTLKDIPDTTEGDVIPNWAVRYEFVFRQAQMQDTEFIASVDAQYVAGLIVNTTKGYDQTGNNRPQVADHWEIDIQANTVAIWVKRSDIGNPPDGTELNTIWVNTFDGIASDPTSTSPAWAWVDHAVDGSIACTLGKEKVTPGTGGAPVSSIKVSILPAGDNFKSVNPGKMVKYSIEVENNASEATTIAFSLSGTPERWKVELPQVGEQSLLFADSFDDNNADGWTTNGGDWSVSNGEYCHTSDSYNYAVVKGAWGDFELKGKVLRGKTTKEGNALGVGLVFRYVDDSNYWRAVQEEGKFMIRGCVKGSWVTVPRAEVDFNNVPQDAWYWIKVNATGDNLCAKIWKDGDAEPAAWTVTGKSSDLMYGGVGFCAIACQAKFDNIALYGPKPVNISAGQKIDTTLTVTAPADADEYETAAITVSVTSPLGSGKVTTVTEVTKSGNFGETPAKPTAGKKFIPGFEMQLTWIALVGFTLAALTRKRRT